MNEITINAIAKWYLGKTTPKDLSDWAIKMIEAEYESKNINIVASMFNENSLFDVEPYFRKAIVDLNWNFPRKRQCLIEWAKIVARKIVEKNMTEMDGCDEMYDIYQGLNYEPELSNWYNLSEGFNSDMSEQFWSPWKEFVPPKKMKEAIVKEAKVLLTKNFSFD